VERVLLYRTTKTVLLYRICPDERYFAWQSEIHHQNFGEHASAELTYL